VKPSRRPTSPNAARPPGNFGDGQFHPHRIDKHARADAERLLEPAEEMRARQTGPLALDGAGRHALHHESLGVEIDDHQRQ
jgi:hypothetical protein